MFGAGLQMLNSLIYDCRSPADNSEFSNGKQLKTYLYEIN